ncbi:MAG: AbrB/MazE/SpoVT family DNA-binding domain-containing protein [Deltaproteobacteria bacterium]|nr:AbrB/MazE/SpoVT family DNA-binding domain-containing protein [Deltaproteobacteria bacterium]
MSATTVTSKGQVTIPKYIREILGIQPGDRVLFFEAEDGRIVVEPETVDVRTLRGLLRHEGPPVSVEEMEEAIARGASASVIP